MSSFQSYSTFSSENLSVSDGEEGNTSDHSHSGPLERLSASQEEHLDELLSHTPDIPIDISTQSDGLSDKECAVRRVKTQISLGKLCSDEHSYEVSEISFIQSVQRFNSALFQLYFSSWKSSNFLQTLRNDLSDLMQIFPHRNLIALSANLFGCLCS